MSNHTDKAAEMRAGLMTIIALAVFTGLEYWVSTAMNGAFVPLTLIALLKAGLIMIVFMHMMKVLTYTDDGDGH